MIIQMSGVPGSGKSTLAQVIAKEINAVIIDHDIIKSPIVLSEFVANKKVTPQEVGMLAYDIDFALADFYLSQGKTVIIDSPCFYENILNKGMELAKKHTTKYKYVECFLDDIDNINNRLRTREKLPSQILHIVPSEHSSKECFSEWIHGMKKPKDDYIVVNTNALLETYLPKVLEYLQK